MTDAALFEGNRLAGRAEDLFDFSPVAQRMARSMAEQTGEDHVPKSPPEKHTSGILPNLKFDNMVYAVLV